MNNVSKLRLTRQSKDLSLDKVSVATGIGKQTLHNWEIGTMKRIGPKYKEESVKLAKLYGVSKKELDSLVQDAWLENKKQTDKYAKYCTDKTLIYESRINKGKTLKDLATLLNTNIYRITTYEKALKVPNDKDINKLAKYLDIDPANLKNDMLKKYTDNKLNIKE